MNEAIDNRELITVAVDGICLRGTRHICPNDRGGLSARLKGFHKPIGLLFLNHGFLPRSAPGDSAVYWAEFFAEGGYPSFRFDLPGLGDSDGNIPPNLLDFINDGGYARVLSATIEEIVERFRLSGVVIVGHCAGAVTALHTAAILNHCKGLVLTDPYFFLAHERSEIANGLGRWASRNRLGAYTRKIYKCFRHLFLLARRTSFPKNANLPLLRCWNRFSSAGLPILVLNAPSVAAQHGKAVMGEFDYLSYLRDSSGSNSNISFRTIEGTDHSFANRVGRSAVRELIDQWLSSHFAVRETEHNAAPHGNLLHEGGPQVVARG